MQTAKLDERGILGRFRAKTKTSAGLFQTAKTVTPGGVSAGIKFFEPYPIFMKRAKGSTLWDIDGNKYVDYLMCYGAIVLGHGDKAVTDAVASVLEGSGTTVFGAPTVVEAEFGAELRDRYHPDGMVRFTNSGLEATLLSVRLARAHTGKRKVAKFEGHYHGAVDSLLFSYAPMPGQGGSAESPSPLADSKEVDQTTLSDSVVLPFNDWEATEKIITRNAPGLSCVIMEPFEEGVIPGDPMFMEKLRKLTQDLHIPLIFDEVKTGFRVRLGGASEFYGITPDLTCLGKIIGGGFPVGAVVGESEIMDLLNPQRSRVFHSGTFNGNPLSLGVGRATVNVLLRKGSFQTLQSRTSHLKDSISKELSRRQVSHKVLGEGGMFNFYITDKPVKNYRDAVASDLRLRGLLDLELITQGVYLKPKNRFCLSLAHSEQDLSLTREKFSTALDAVMPPSLG